MKSVAPWKVPLSVVAFLLCSVLFYVQAGNGKAKKPLPKFEDYPVAELWRGPTAPLKFSSRSARMFRAQFTEAAKKPPDFAGHYRFTDWGCGTQCLAGGIVDLKVGQIFSLPLTKNTGSWGDWIYCASSDNTVKAVEYRMDSRMMVVRCGLACDDDANITPDVYYFLWEHDHFRQLAYVRGKGNHACARLHGLNTLS